MTLRSRASRLARISLLGSLALLLCLPAGITLAMPADTVHYTVDRIDDVMVNTGCDDGLADSDCSLRGVITLANSLVDGSVIHIDIPAGTYILALSGDKENGNLTGDLDVTHNDVTLTGAGSATTILNANHLDRVLDHHNGSLHLAGLKITGGQAPAGYTGGGGILNRSGSSLSLDDVVVDANTVLGTDRNQSYGGGIGNVGILTIQDSTISSNEGYFGGGIANYGTLILQDSSVNSNNARNVGDGGGIATTEYSSLSIQRSTINNNCTDLTPCGDGGGIYRISANVTITDTTIRNNYANYGGGIYSIGDDTLMLNRVTLSANSGYISGGGIANYGDLSLNNVTLSSNSSGSGGGMSNYDSGSAVLNHCTFANNTAQNSGYAYYAEVYSEQTFHNTILASSDNQKTCFFGSNTSASAILHDAGYNLYTDLSYDHICPLSAGNHNLLGIADPMLEILANYGGYTSTLALKAGSPAIDAGDPLSFLGVDQRRYFRPGAGSSLPDIGAFEFNGLDLVLDQLFYLPVIHRSP